MKYLALALLMSSCSPVVAQEIESVPMIQGTILLLDQAGNVEPIIADRMFNTVDECYSVGQAALVVFIPQMPNVVGYMIVCEPAGTDV